MFKHIYQINEQAFIIDFGSIINTEINDIVINYHNYIRFVAENFNNQLF